MQTFENDRLLFRLLQPADEKLYCACYTDPALMQLIATPLTEEAALRSFTVALKMNSALPIRRRDWVIHEKQSGLDAGLVTLACDSIKPEPLTGQLGVILFPDFQGKGYSTEATGAATDAVFGNTSLDTLYVHHTSQNIAVSRVTQKLGYLREMPTSDQDADWHWILTRRRWQDLKA